MARRTIKCHHCGVEFSTTRRVQKYCTRRCANRFRARHNPGQRWDGNSYRWYCPMPVRNAHGVYFVLCTGTGMVKVGHTREPVAGRLTTLQTGNPSPLVLLLLLEGEDQRMERALHRALGDYRIAGSEWFYPSLPVLALMVRLSEGYPTALHGDVRRLHRMFEAAATEAA